MNGAFANTLILFSVMSATKFSDTIKSQRNSFQQAIQKKLIYAKFDSII